MATITQIMGAFQQQAALFSRRISAFFSFLGMKLKNFKTLTTTEQVSFGLIGIGLIFIVTSIVLFLL